VTNRPAKASGTSKRDDATSIKWLMPLLAATRLRDDRPDEGHCDCDFERGKEKRHRPGQPDLLDDFPARGVKGPRHVLQLGFRCRYPGRDVHNMGKNESRNAVMTAGTVPTPKPHL